MREMSFQDPRPAFLIWRVGPSFSTAFSTVRPLKKLQLFHIELFLHVYRAYVRIARKHINLKSLIENKISPISY